MSEDSIIFVADDGEEVSFFVIEQITIAGERFLLVTSDPDEEEAEVLIMREVMDEDEQLVYEIVEDEGQLAALSRVFEEQMDDVDIRL